MSGHYLPQFTLNIILSVTRTVIFILYTIYIISCRTIAHRANVCMHLYSTINKVFILSLSLIVDQK